MKKKSLLVLFICVLTAMTCFNVSATHISEESSYIYDNTQRVITAPISHILSSVVTNENLKIDELKDVADIQVHNNELYILEKTKGKIFVIDQDNNLIRIIGETLGLNLPESFYIGKNGYIYIADTANNRILKLDINGNLIKEIKEPNKKKTLSEVEFLPEKIVVDSGERIYVIVKNETNGIYQLDIDGNFLGYFGSVPVVPDFSELFWRTVSTKEQLKKMLLFVPTEYSSMDIDKSDFIYTTVATNTDTEIRNYIKGGGSGSTLAPIRRLNPKNIDVLVRNGSMPPAGDLIDTVDWRTDSGNASRFVEISVKDNGMYCALDVTRSRVFTYDKEGNLLYIFGNNDNTHDGLLKPNAICWWNDKIVVSDTGNKVIKIYEPTDYAMLIDKAIGAEVSGNYDVSYGCWQQLLKIHSGNNLACMGMGKYYMRQGDYTEAMKWFKQIDSKENYSLAFKKYRKEVGYTVTGIAIVGIVISVIAIAVIKKVRKHKVRDKKSAKENSVLNGFKYGFYIMRHPFDGFWDMQFENKGNLVSATMILVITVAINLIGCFATGYLISGNKSAGYNVLIQGVLSIILPFGLWCVANWSVTSLMNGSGTFKYVYMYSCYCLTPLLIGMPFMIILSNVLSLDEMMLYTIINTLIYIWAAFLLFVGTLTVHQYTPIRTTVSILLIVVAMAIIVFILLLCTTIIQQVTDFIGLLLEEIRLRA